MKSPESFDGLSSHCQRARFRVQACFDTAAHELILSAEASENSALLIADDCSVELRVAPVSSGAAGAAGVSPTTHALTALPWDCSRMRLGVNGISYGTGPLVLRDGDELTLHPNHVTEATTSYTYNVKAVPASADVAGNEMGDGPPLETRPSASEENHRLRVIMSNMEQYAKWNNFYSERFTNLATVSVPPSNGTCTTGQLHKCACGSYVQAEVGTSDAMPRETHPPNAAQTPLVWDADADVNKALPSAHARTLVTLLPSLPQLLDFGSPATQPPTAPRAPLPATCCCCPFTSASSNPALRLCRKKSAYTSAAAPPSSIGESSDAQQVCETGPSLRVDARQTSWSVYAQARRDDCVAAPQVSNAKKAVDAPNSDAFLGGASLGRPAVALLNRISSLESALMGLRYE
ncbi:conserved hypothetical protein [Leishmania infantum JPCM5]|uniref:Uncharacterized protein n=2 Tax=Leishmania infantum TaxID=5671 RepID=A4IA21_LEIIN|nr:conserved hypothetical protein [Leishmania infantum JPCM5]CAC9539191.1 hypothetical_protein_-_conserved [Leishmania infantum]CAM71677.1 conserved hypothetical protein [Leishmania infantum JPCM5]SUZ45611.1 hypothetical_protein_-_conserved [Leishmania infantum]|eukprot:XP_001468590.1 conserved hypothetical protein [Leishmania infantum JPCM5]